MSDAERRIAWWRAVWQALEHWQTWTAWLLFIPLASAGRWLGSLVGHEEIGLSIGIAISVTISYQVRFRFVRLHLIEDGVGGK
ncbi:MAG TPA: hypothetical protein VGI22_11010 [Xanthobacteraceae bacterium]